MADFSLEPCTVQPRQRCKCGEKIHRDNAKGMCNACYTMTPEFREYRKNYIAGRMKDPLLSERRLTLQRDNLAKQRDEWATRLASGEKPPERSQGECGGCGKLLRRDNRSGYCTLCFNRLNSIMQSAKVKSDPTLRAKAAENNLKYTRRRCRTPEFKMLYLMDAARRRAATRGVPFDMTIKDISPFPEFCPVLTHIRLNYLGTGVHQDDSASIDRILPERGYVRGNVRIVSWRANRLKSDATSLELYVVALDMMRIERELGLLKP